MDRERYEDGIRYIADMYGLVDQAWKLVEELSEPLVAVMHDDEEPDIDVEMHFKDGSVVKAYTDEEGRMVFKPQGKGAKEDV